MKYTWHSLQKSANEVPSLDAKYQAWESMRTVCITGWARECLSCELIVEVPGPVYVFHLEIEPLKLATDELYIICGALPFFSTDVPHDRGLVKDAEDRLLLYFCHLLLYCYCRPRYEPPMRLIDSLSLKRLSDTEATKKMILEKVTSGIRSLGYSSNDELMPILSEFAQGIDYLDGNYYSARIEKFIDIEILANIGEHKARELIPVLST